MGPVAACSGIGMTVWEPNESERAGALWVPALSAGTSGEVELYGRRFVRSWRRGIVVFAWFRGSAQSRVLGFSPVSVTNLLPAALFGESRSTRL